MVRSTQMPLQNAWLSVFLVLALLSTDTLRVLTEAKRGGGGGGFGRGGSAGRSSGGGGLFGGSRSSGTRTGTSGGIGGGNRNTGGASGGLFGGSSSNHRTGYNQGGGGYGKYSQSKYSKGSGMGSMARSSTFKNMVVGAAAGYLTYQAGKAIIRSTMSPMMWGGRSYYWGQNHYQGPTGGQMCRMPLEGDTQFGNVYFNDGSRPKEIVWSCRYNEYCCGYECCPGGGSYGGGYGYRGIGLGSIIVLLLLFGCVAFVIYQVCKARRSGGGGGGGPSFFNQNAGNSKYSQGQAYAPANEPPPQYTASGQGYPPQPHPPGFVYS